MPQDCQNITTDLKLVREGISQNQRMPDALKPSYIPVDERGPADDIVFAKAFTAFVNFFETPTTSGQTWQSFFRDDVTVQLATEITQLLANQAIQEAGDIRAKIKRLQTQLEKSYTEQSDHSPHFALFLAFVRLMQLAREQTNTLTARHLDFYYREVLQLREKPAEPGHVHLLVELLKNLPSHAIAENTAFKAGKDDKKNEVFFKSDRELIANQAKVVALKSIYIKDGRLFAPLIANSDDGLQPELTSPDGSWDAFRNEKYEKLSPPTEKEPPRDEIGFAIASHYLFMAGGTRTILLNINTSTAAHCTAYLTTEKGWLKKSIGTEKGQLKIEVMGDEDAIVPYNFKTHGYAFDTTLPVLMVKLNQEAANGYYHQFKGIVLTNCNLTVKVDGLKNLAVSNDFGPIDIAKPFQPFGALPQKGSALIVGSKELFQKEYTGASLNVSWQNAPQIYKSATDRSTPPNYEIRLLQNGNWMPAETNNVSTFNIPKSTPNSNHDFTENEELEANSKNGFLKISLFENLGFNTFQRDLIDTIIKKETPPLAPIAPTIDSLSLTYTATDDQASFFHVTPFGQKSLAISTKLFPPFESQHPVEPNASKDSIAEFYIGITDLKPPQNLSLLFQVADGTANPLAQKPKPQHLYWSYLSNNEWIPFKNDRVNDTTGELLRSGIVTLGFPNEQKATADNTLLPKGLFWVKIAVKDKSDAVCKLIRVAAQALRATFDDRKNDPAFSAKVLLAETISKLEDPQAAVRKVEQPFASFGGRGAEAAETFYTRVSERLRHKDRAVALWDYEHLVLEAFPQIYKVKCLNHTHYESSESGVGIYNELAPGHVTVVTIPNQAFHKAIDPLQPYTSLGVLDEIAVFLQKRVSCFVELHVQNPEFEKVRTEFKVKFYAGMDETYHKKLLQKSITRFLSPWAYGGASPSFGGKIYKSALINFIEEQPYVDYITDFKLFDKSNADQNEVTPSKAISILVSVPEEEHTIKDITENTPIDSSPSCLCHS